MLPRGIPGSPGVPINLVLPPPIPFSYRVPDAVAAGGTSDSMTPPPPASSGAVATYHMPPLLLPASHLKSQLLPASQLAASLEVGRNNPDPSIVGYGGFFQAVSSSLGPIVLAPVKAGAPTSPTTTAARPGAPIAAPTFPAASASSPTPGAVPVVRPLAAHHPARAASAVAVAAAAVEAASLSRSQPPLPATVALPTPKAAVPPAGKSAVDPALIRGLNWQRALTLAEARQVSRGQLTWRDAMQYKIAPVDLNSRQRAMLRRQQAINALAPSGVDAGNGDNVKREDTVSRSASPRTATRHAASAPAPVPRLQAPRGNDPVATLAAAAAAVAAEGDRSSPAASVDADVLSVDTGGDVVEIIATAADAAPAAATTTSTTTTTPLATPLSPAAPTSPHQPRVKIIRRSDVNLRLEAARAGLAAAREQGSGESSEMNGVLVFTKNGGRRGPSSTTAVAAAFAASVRQHDDPTAQMIATSRFRSTVNNRAPSLKGTDPGSVVENAYCASLPASRFRHPYDHCRFIADALLADVLSLVSDLFNLVLELGDAAFDKDPVAVARLPLRQVRRPDEVAPLSLFRSRKRIALYLTSEVLATFHVLRTMATKPVYVAVAAQVRLDERMQHLENRIDTLTRFSRARHVVCVHSDFSRAHRLSYRAVQDAQFSPVVRAAMAAAADGKPHEPVGGRLHRKSVKGQRTAGVRGAAKASVPVVASDGSRQSQPEDDDAVDLADWRGDEDNDASAMLMDDDHEELEEEEEEEDHDGMEDDDGSEEQEDEDEDEDNGAAEVDDDAHGESAASTLVALAGRI